MSLIKSSETKPERQIRAELFRMGFRFRKNDRRLLGKPDIVLPHYHAVVFVNGCFWHAHGCSRFKMPKTNPEFWKEKFERNKARDREQVENPTCRENSVCLSGKFRNKTQSNHCRPKVALRRASMDSSSMIFHHIWHTYFTKCFGCQITKPWEK